MDMIFHSGGVDFISSGWKPREPRIIEDSFAPEGPTLGRVAGRQTYDGPIRGEGFVALCLGAPAPS